MIVLSTLNCQRAGAAKVHDFRSTRFSPRSYVLFAMPLLLDSVLDFFCFFRCTVGRLATQSTIRLEGFFTSCYCQVQISISGGFLLHTVAFRLATRHTFRISGLYFLLSFCSGLIFVEFTASQFG